MTVREYESTNGGQKKGNKTKKGRLMIAKQLSVFIENRQGRLGEVLEALKKGGVNILSLSLADTAEYGLLRLILNNPEEGKKILAASGFSSMLTDVSIIKIPHKSGSLQGLLEMLAENDLNVEYMYALSVEGKTAYIVLKTSDMKKTDEIFDERGVLTLSSSEISDI